MIDLSRLNIDPILLLSTLADLDGASAEVAPRRPPWSFYQKAGLLGSGLFGEVYEGWGNKGVWFAVKEIPLPNQESKVKQAFLQFECEIAMLAKLEHINIVKYFGTQMEDDKLLLFSELMSKGSLASVYKQYHGLHFEQIQTYTNQILSGLNYLHDRNIIHGNIKCANVLVDNSGVVKLADIGMAQQLVKLNIDKSCNASHVLYMAPEMLGKEIKPSSCAADIWSVGCTVLEMALGKQPIEDSTLNRAFQNKILSGKTSHVPDMLPGDLKDFILTCLEMDPAKRATCRALRGHSFITGKTPSDLDFEMMHFRSPVGKTSEASSSELRYRHAINEDMGSVRLKDLSWWRKVTSLGNGIFGTVFEGAGNNGEVFAVKEVPLSYRGAKDNKQALLHHLEREISILIKLQHPNIVKYLGAQRDQEKLYIFLELVRERSLASMCKQYPMLPDQIRSYTTQILLGLRYLHNQNIIHRNLKCANIFVHTSGVLKLADFGMAKVLGKMDNMKSKSVIETTHWMAPEVVNPSKTYSLAADIWSVGCTILEMATGQPPFGDMEVAVVFWKVGSGEAPPIPSHLPEDLKDFISQCLEVDGAKRPTCDMLLTHPFLDN